MSRLGRIVLVSCAALMLAAATDAGQGSKESNRKAREALESAAAKGSSPAQYALGVAAETEGNFPEAVTWYRRAANQGYALAQFKLGQLLEDGRGVGADATQPREWYRKAAAQGVTAKSFAPSSSKAGSESRQP